MTVTSADLSLWRLFTQDDNAFAPTAKFEEWGAKYSEQTVRSVLTKLIEEGYCFGGDEDWQPRLERAFWKWNSQGMNEQTDPDEEILSSMDRFVGAQNTDDTRAMIAELRRRKFTQAEILGAIDSHRDDITRNSQGQPNGKFRPGYTEVLAKIEENKQVVFPAERAGSYAAEQEQEREDAADDEFYTEVPIENEQLVKWMGKGRTIRCRRAFCKDCQDTGWARFFFDPTDPRRVFTPDQYNELPDEVGLKLNVSTATCACVRGVGGILPSGHEIRGRRAEMAGAVHPFHGGCKPSFRRIKRMAEARVANDAFRREAAQ